MPKGQVEPREVICRACDEPFTSNKVGRAAHYCHRPECDEERAAKRSARPRPRPHSTRSRPELTRPLPPMAPKRQEPHRPLDLDGFGPLAQDIVIIARMAMEMGPSPRVLKDTVLAVARSGGDRRFLYRRLAASALALAAHVGGHRF